jgi:hypothetical protein
VQECETLFDLVNKNFALSDVFQAVIPVSFCPMVTKC